MNQFEVYKSWLLDELYLLACNHDNENPNWPKEHQVHKDDVIPIIDLFNTIYDDRKVHCGLINIIDKINEVPTIEYAFYSFHIIGHAVLEELRTDLTHESLIDIAHMELVSALFAIIACHRYFGMKHLTPKIVKEIAHILTDNHFAETQAGKESCYSVEQRLLDVQLIFEDVIENEKDLLQ